MQLKISDNGLNPIKQAEGFVDHVYPDAHGKDAIGYGHDLVPSPPHTTYFPRAGGDRNHQQAGSHLRPCSSRSLHREGTSLISVQAERFRRMIILADRHRCASLKISVSAGKENETGNAINIEHPTSVTSQGYCRLGAIRSTSKVRSGNVGRKRGEGTSPKFHWGSQYTFRGWMGSTSPT